MNRLEETAIAWPVNGMPHTLAARTRRVYDRLAAVYPVSTMFFHSRAHGCALGASGLRDAQVTLVRLSKVLGRFLRKHQQSSALRDELSFIEDYLAIEVARFGNVLKFVRDAAGDTLDMLVPSMLLHPLVANSIQHGAGKNVEGGTIRIRNWRTNKKPRLLVQVDGGGIPEEKLATLLDQGIGVSNVLERLIALVGSKYRMWIESQTGEGAHIEIEVLELQGAVAAF